MIDFFILTAGTFVVWYCLKLKRDAKIWQEHRDKIWARANRNLQAPKMKPIVDKLCDL